MDGQQVEDFSPEEQDLLRTIDEQKQVYQSCTQQLRNVKSEIERIQQILEQNKKRLQREFEQWFLQLREIADPKKFTGDEARALLEEAPGDGGSSLSSARLRPEMGVGSLNSTDASLRPDGMSGSAKIELTGDADVDADIQAYYKARQAL